MTLFALMPLLKMLLKCLCYEAMLTIFLFTDCPTASAYVLFYGVCNYWLNLGMVTSKMYLFFILVCQLSALYDKSTKYSTKHYTKITYKLISNWRTSTRQKISLYYLDWRHMTLLCRYLTRSKLIQITFSFKIQFVKNKKITIGLLNPGSLGTRHEEFLVAMARYSVDIMAINETWLRAGEEARAPAPPGYRLRHIPRPADVRARGGGVGFYLKRGLNARLIAHPPVHSVEQMWLGFNINGTKFAIGTAYRPPWLSTDVFIDALTESISSLAEFDNLILLGDFNINIMNAQEANLKKINEFLTCMNLIQYVNQPTHFTEHSETLIDVICSNMRVSNVSVNYIPTLSNHGFLTCEINIKKQKIPRKLLTYRPLKDIVEEIFIQDMNSMSLENLSGNVNEMVEALNTNLLALFDVHAPVKRTYVKEGSYPWITCTIREMMKLRDEAHSRSRLTKLDVHKKYYKDLKGIVSIAMLREKTAYFNRNINCIKNPRKLWKNIKQNVANFKKTDSQLPTHLSNPNKINEHFLNLPSNNEISISLLTYYEFHQFDTNVFKFSPVTESLVFNIIKSITTKAQGDDGLNINMISLTLPVTLTAITAIVNKSMETGIFPDQWKIAVVKPIPKIQNPNDYKDLRPISILSVISKIMEKVVCMQITQYLEANNILPKKQSGFRKSHSTATALLDVVDNVLAAQDVDEGTILVLLDFSRAFDTIDTSLLLSKLAFYGFDSLSVKWFHSYLIGRKQYVKICNGDGTDSVSSIKPVTRGVPQGSILGPTLFCLYCADIIDRIKNCNYQIYADDIQLYLSFKTNETSIAVNKVNEDLYNIVSWSHQNNLILNPSKSKFMLLGTRKQIDTISLHDPHVSIKDFNLERVAEARNLGLVMDESLRFEKHVAETMRNCFYRLKVLYQIRECLSVDMRIQLCDSLILSKLNYGDVVFGGRLLVRTGKALQRIQNACARFCFPIPRRAHVTPFLNRYDLMNMGSRRHLHFATLLFGVIKNKEPAYLFEKLNFSQRAVRHASRLASHPHRKVAFRGSFRFAATKCWNDLPPPIRNSNTVASFKMSLRKFLIDKQKM